VCVCVCVQLCVCVAVCVCARKGCRTLIPILHNVCVELVTVDSEEGKTLLSNNLSSGEHYPLDGSTSMVNGVCAKCVLLCACVVMVTVLLCYVIVSW